MGTFAGFGKHTLGFLEELREHNNRDWFNERKERYEEDVRGVALDYIVAMGPPLEKISDHFEAIPKKVGGSLMRPYRDTRFGKDKTPYKTNIGMQFRHERGKDVHAPGFYVHIEPDECFLGVGLWRPEPPDLAAIRQHIVEHPKEWQKITRAKAFATNFELGGSSLKRPPRGFDADHPCIEDLKRKDFIASCTITPSEIGDPSFVKLSAQRFKQAGAFMAFLCRSMGLAY